jgi:hypothetical protein
MINILVSTPASRYAASGLLLTTITIFWFLFYPLHFFLLFCMHGEHNSTIIITETTGVSYLLFTRRLDILHNGSN